MNQEYLNSLLNQARQAIETKNLKLAEELCQKALELSPDSSEVNQLIQHIQILSQKWSKLLVKHLQKSNIYHSSGQMQKCIQQLNLALEISQEYSIKLRLDLLLPPIYQSREDVIDWKHRFEENLNLLLKEHQAIIEPTIELEPSPLFLLYQEFNDRELKSKLAQLYLQLLKPFQLEYEGKPAETIKKLGIYSSFFYNHSVTHYFSHLLCSIPEDKYELYLITPESMPEDEQTFRLKNHYHHHVKIPDKRESGTMKKAYETLSQLNLDILIYTDIGADPFTYCLAFGRAAKTQCVLSGDPGTTGIPSIDYFISYDLMELANAQDFYSETLIKLKGLPIAYPEPQLKSPIQSRQDLNLPLNKNLYTCPMTLYKIHPDFDIALKTILDKDPQAHIIFFNLQTKKHLYKRLIERFSNTIGHLERISFLNWMSFEDFLAVLQHSQVVLDTFHFGGGSTAFLTLATGTPMVTWPSSFLRGRTCSALYQLMNLDDCIAHSRDDYPELAVKIATNPDYQQQLRQTILSNKHIIFNQYDEGIQAFIEFLESV